MNVAEEYLKYLETPEGKEEAKKWVSEYVKKEETKNEQIKNLMSNTKYIDWLNQFTYNKGGFCDDDWVYFPEKINDCDRENVEKLCLFYEGIEKYAEQNYIYPTLCEFGNFYRIKLNEFYLEVGILVGQGTRFFCNKSSLDNEKKFIDFNDIMLNKKQEKVDNIDKILYDLSNLVKTACESGVPVEAIVNTLNDTINKLESKKEDNQKILIKKQL